MAPILARAVFFASPNCCSITSKVTRDALLPKRAPSKANPTAPAGHSCALSSHATVPSGSTKRRISQAQARRSAHGGLRVAHTLRCSGSLGLAPAWARAGKSSLCTEASAAASATLARCWISLGKKSSALIASSSRRCLFSTRDIALGSDMPKPTLRLSTTLISSA